jgi:protein Mpv17
MRILLPVAVVVGSASCDAWTLSSYGSLQQLLSARTTTKSPFATRLYQSSSSSFEDFTQATLGATAKEKDCSEISFTETIDTSIASLNDSSSIASATLHFQSLLPKLLNAAFLATAFGFAAYEIFTIDHGMTRGWTQSEIAMRIPLDNWNHYETSLAENPIYTKTLINVVIYLLGDWLSQTIFQKKHVLDFDVMRTLRNGCIGVCFGPLVHEYYQFSDRILPVEGGILNRVEKIIMDQTIYLTVKCSIYIMAVGLLQGESLEDAKRNVKERIGGIVFTAWKFWPLVHCITYGVIPARHRILWVSYCLCIHLSVTLLLPLGK